jgi:hypothetical protein
MGRLVIVESETVYNTTQYNTAKDEEQICKEKSESELGV